MPKIEESECACARLFRIVGRIRAIGHNGSAQIGFWPKVFGVDAKDTAAVVQCLAYSFSLIDQAKSEIRGLDVDHSLYLPVIDDVKNAFDQMAILHSWDHVFKLLNDQVFRSLHFVAEGAARSLANRAIEKSELDGLLAAADLLLEELRAANLDDAFKASLIEDISNIRRSVLTYDLRGTAGLRNSMATLIGDLVANRKSVPSDPQASPFRSIWVFLERINTALSLAGGFAELPANLTAIAGLLG